MSYRPKIGGKLREETSGVDRSQAGCAAKLVYSTWKITQPGERNGKAIYRNRLASQPVRSAAAHPAAPLPPPRRSASGSFATDGSAGNQMQFRFFVLRKTKTRL
jgi:hypothetical protein